MFSNPGPGEPSTLHNSQKLISRIQNLPNLFELECTEKEIRQLEDTAVATNLSSWPFQLTYVQWGKEYKKNSTKSTITFQKI